MVKNLPASAGDVDLIPGSEDPLEKEMATHSSILAWRIPWTEEPEGPQSMGHKESDTTERLHQHHHIYKSTCELLLEDSHVCERGISLPYSEGLH